MHMCDGRIVGGGPGGGLTSYDITCQHQVLCSSPTVATILLRMILRLERRRHLLRVEVVVGKVFGGVYRIVMLIEDDRWVVEVVGDVDETLQVVVVHPLRLSHD